MSNEIHVILEGPDNSGKSTLAATLKERIQGEHLKAIHTDDDEVTVDRVAEYLMTIKQPGYHEPIVIWDRWYYPSDLVYNPIVAKMASPLGPYTPFIEKMLNKANTMILHVTSNKDDLIRRLSSRGDDYMTTDMYDAIIARYDAFFKMTKLPHKTINTSNHDAAMTVELALMYIEQFYEERTGKACKWLV